MREQRPHTVDSANTGDALVLFGITGDLGFKKLLPALYHLAANGQLEVPVIGVASTDWTVEDLKARGQGVWSIMPWKSMTVACAGMMFANTKGS